MLFGFFGISASVGLAIALVQLVGAIGKAENALPLQEVLQARLYLCAHNNGDSCCCMSLI